MSALPLKFVTSRAGALAGSLGMAVIAAALTFSAMPEAPPALAQSGSQAGAQPGAAAPAHGAQGAMPAFSADQRTAIEQIVREYLIANPDVLVEVTKELEKRQQAAQAEQQQKMVTSQKDEIFRSPFDFVMGNPKGNITIVEYFDYNCGWCKRAVGEITKLIEADPNVRVVFKEFPIFGENSQTAALAAMASIKQGKYWEFHVALMKERQVTKDNVFTIAQAVGLDVAKLKADMADAKLQEALKRNSDIAQALGIEGTPGFLIDSRVNVGFVPAAGIKEIIADVRKQGCQVC